MAKTKEFRLVGKLYPCGACELIKAKAKLIPATLGASKEGTAVGEKIFVDITCSFPLTATKWHKSTRDKLFWHGNSDQFSGKMITSFQYTKTKLVELVNETFKYVKGRKSNVKYSQMDNVG